MSACDQQPTPNIIVESNNDNTLTSENTQDSDQVGKNIVENLGFSTPDQLVGVETQPANNEQTPSSSANSSTDIEGDKKVSKDIVENFGFSTPDKALDFATPSNNGDTGKRFCLDLNASDSADSNEAEIVQQSCTKISNRLASVSMDMCTNVQLRTSNCLSVNGFPIMFSEFPPIEGTKTQGRILLVGGTHGDELTSVSIVFRWLQKLKIHHSGLFHWHVAPLVNPDGLLLKEATRTNINGVDLNRNLPSNDWHANALNYWHGKASKNPRRYPGELPNSEPESQWLVDEINEFKPDAIISVHAPYGMIDFDSHLLNTAPKSLGKLHLNLLGTYPGSLGNYAGIDRNIPVITLELPHAWVMPSDTESNKIWEDLVGWLSKNINHTEPSTTD